MQRRWGILVLLFTVRTAMAFQFQSVAAVAPALRSQFGVSLDDLGLLIGIYLAPGLALALPGGAIGQRYGDKKIIVLGLLLMICGGLVMALAEFWSLQIAGRLLAGTGGVLLNVLMSKMVTDWFAGKEIATAMAIFVNSWPAGIALALILLPPIAETLGLPWTFLATTALVMLGTVAFMFVYPSPQFGTGELGSKATPGPRVFLALIAAGLVWGLYNASFSMVFSFGPLMLTERGWSLAEASWATSLVLWSAVLTVPLGGWLADRTGRHQAVLLGGLLAFALILILAARVDAIQPAFIALGLVSGLSAGPIMSLPSRVLLPSTRAVGMGMFYTLFYLCVVFAPWAAGKFADFWGNAAMTFDLGAAMLIVSCVVYWFFGHTAQRVHPVA